MSGANEGVRGTTTLLRGTQGVPAQHGHGGAAAGREGPGTSAEGADDSPLLRVLLPDFKFPNHDTFRLLRVLKKVA